MDTVHYIYIGMAAGFVCGVLFQVYFPQLKKPKRIRKKVTCPRCKSDRVQPTTVFCRSCQTTWADDRTSQLPLEHR